MSGLIVVIGSGELGNSMRSTHRRVLEHIGANSITVLDSPYGFQENADDLTRRIVAHFQEAFGTKAEVASLRSPDATDDERRSFIKAIGRAQVVFAGPGSPSYTLRVWADLGVREALTAVVDRGGAVVMASAAALTIGAKAIPVYEIYKVGEDLHWLNGLDLLSHFGLNWVVVPHWNNREGGFHDTSHCFVGARRFHRLVEMLPETISIIGVDEHTSLIIDPFQKSMSVFGKGAAYLNDDVIRQDQGLSTPSGRPTGGQIIDLPPDEHDMATNEDDRLIDLLVEVRSRARDRGDFEESDHIRDGLAEFEIEVQDHPDGTSWSRR